MVDYIILLVLIEPREKRKKDDIPNFRISQLPTDWRVVLMSAVYFRLCMIYIGVLNFRS